MSRPHADRSRRHDGPTNPAPTRADYAAPQSAPFLNPHAHARFGHSFAQLSAFPEQAAPERQDAAPIQREAEEGEEMETEGAEGEEMQMKAEGRTAARPDVPLAAGGGSPLPPPVRTRMEAAFGHPFDDVRVHSGPEAKTVGALAYTRGADVHFQPGLYDPHTPGGQELLGHELTHVVQQRAGRVAAPSRGEGDAPINADPALEAEADRQGALAARGERAAVSGAGSGLQRKADGSAPIQRDVIQRDEDDEFKDLDMKAPVKPNEFLPNRRVTPPADNSPERANVRPNVTNVPANAYNNQAAADRNKVTTFRNRMAGEMAAQKTMLTNNDALPADEKATEPTVKNPEGFSSFLTQQSSEREKELDALRAGTLGSGPARTDAKGTALVNRLGVVPQTSGEFEQDGATRRLNGSLTARPAAATRAIAPSRPVTGGTTTGKTAYNGDGDEVKTRVGNPLEYNLNNPSQSTAFVDNHGGLKYPREGLAARQQSIMATAEKADPLMHDLDATNALPTHVAAHNRHENGGWLWPGHSVQGSTVVNQDSDPLYAVGTNFFDEQRPIRSGGEERLLPQMTHRDNAAATNPNRGNESRPNVWSEADVKPATVDNVNNPWRHAQNGYAAQRWPRVQLEQRNEERLLHTHPNSRVAQPDGRGGTESKPVDFRYHVTNDHYKSAVPVAPVQEDYKVNHPYSPPLMPENSPLMPASGLPAPYKTNSLGVQQNQAENDERKDAGDLALAANTLHNASQETRDVAERDRKTQAGEAAVTSAGDEAKQSSRRRANKESRRVNGAAFAEDQLSVQAGRDAERASARRDRDERDRVKWEGRGEDALPDKALADAQAASARREALEEARTQGDLKAFTPSAGVQAMYGGMSARTAQTAAARQMEMQHQAASAWTAEDHVVDAPGDYHKPMSEEAKDMYG